ncbi:hypothetical protein [Cryobacterium sp.]|uniref:hypothetical protein n=1 Tax=Cryobacterium sp. TaxID=1926290 RepID=UPI00260809CB|nr:hypothetical protein [Cryobacterium sp.]MCU1446391.1 hypothetical protein [Cryobacterium sp.]
MADTTVRVGTGALVGHRLTRRIGSDSRAEVFLAQASTEGRSSVPVVLKVFRHGTDPTGIGREVHAMLSSAPGALPRLDDVATTPDGRVCLVLAHLPGLALNRLLAVRGRIGAAEVVTVAATATACLQAVHDVGLSLPLVRPSGVRFDDRGRPVLLGLGSLADLPGGVAGVATRRDDAVGLARFLHALLEFLDPDDAAASRAPALVAEFESAVLTRPFPATLVGLEAALFAWAPAGPVRGAVPGAAPDAETGMVADVVPRAMNAPAPAGRPRLAPVSVSASAAPAPAAAGSGLPVLARVGRWVGGTPLGSAARNVVAQAGRLGSFRRRERGSRFARLPGARPLLLAAGLAAVISVGGFGALSLLPGEGAGGVVASPPASDPAATDPDGTGPDGTGADGADPSTSDPSILEGDDPAAAVLELLRLRDVCLAHVSVLCLDGVDQHGSVAMAADGYRIRQLQGDDARTAAPDAAAPEADPLARFTARVQEHTGNSALVVLEAGAGVNAQPASALVIKGEAGWRLRELFDY